MVIVSETMTQTITTKNGKLTSNMVYVKEKFYQNYFSVFHSLNEQPSYINSEKNRFNRHLVDIFTDEKKVVVYKAPYRATDFDEKQNLCLLAFWRVFIAKEDEQVCCINFKTKEKQISSIL